MTSARCQRHARERTWRVEKARDELVSPRQAHLRRHRKHPVTISFSHMPGTTPHHLPVGAPSPTLRAPSSASSTSPHPGSTGSSPSGPSWGRSGGSIIRIRPSEVAPGRPGNAEGGARADGETSRRRPPAGVRRFRGGGLPAPDGTPILLRRPGAAQGVRGRVTLTGSSYPHHAKAKDRSCAHIFTKGF